LSSASTNASSSRAVGSTATLEIRQQPLDERTLARGIELVGDDLARLVVRALDRILEQYAADAIALAFELAVRVGRDARRVLFRLRLLVDDEALCLLRAEIHHAPRIGLSGVQ
jgi:hypothetical protein